jgi:transcriptional regulator with XRE-family HTH domain
MLKLSLQNRLGNHLKRERKARQLTQNELAARVNVSIPTIRLLERGQGNLSSFWSVLEAWIRILKGILAP